MRISLVYLALFFSVLCMSFSSIMIKFCTAPAIIIALYRVFFTSGLAAFIRGPRLAGSLRSLSRRDLKLTMVSGFFLALHLGFWITSLSYTSVSSSVLFTNLQVIFVLVLSIVLLKEKPGRMAILGIFIALAGSFCIAQGDLSRGRFLGDMLSLASGLFVGIYYLIGRQIRARVDTMTYTAINCAVACLFLALFCLATGQRFTGYPYLDWLLFLLMALGPGLAGHGLLNWALKYLQAPTVSVSILGESVGASILAYFIFGENLLWYQISGGLLILTGIYIAAVNEGQGIAD
ncbi:DMT family transporter [Syntrophomonas palmitatica]|uniref:DMT family transporter n=1 Tax=Syntrophomonas palmitatica TaxID=402877 RepID=UPI0006CF2456|nr:DMT family transporter [Syntrophomonas palmitatica]